MSGASGLQGRLVAAALAVAVPLLALLFARSKQRTPQRQDENRRILAVTRYKRASCEKLDDGVVKMQY